MAGDAHEHADFVNFLVVFNVQAQLWFFTKPDKTKNSVNIIGNFFGTSPVYSVPRSSPASITSVKRRKS